MKRKRSPNYLFNSLILSAVLCFAHACIAGSNGSDRSFCVLKSFKGKVVDADTSEPIEGAVVMAVYYGSGYSVAGEHLWPVYAQETLTDSKGEFEIKSKTIFGSKVLGRPQAELIIFKQGFGAFPEHTKTEAVNENKKWPPSGKYVLFKLPELHTFDERKNNVRYMSKYDEIPFDQKAIYWDMVNQELTNVKLPINTK